MVRKTDAYVDTSALIAFVDRSDGYHTLFRGRFADPPPLLTTTLVVAEGHGWFLRRYDRVRALQFLSLIEDLAPLEIAQVGVREQQGGVRMLRRFSDQDMTMTDAVGLHLMGTRRVRTCWSTDFHMGLTGVALVIHER
jgi:predicted nucleic acid-binding protein